jgi:hypothetical protein
MAERVSARLTRREARRFGLVVGSAFLALGLLVWWRGHPLVSQVFWVIGAALVLSGIVLPDHLHLVYRAWMGLALAISKVTTPILMGFLYFGVITPIGLIRRVLGHDALRRSRAGDSSFIPRDATQQQSQMKHQF